MSSPADNDKRKAPHPISVSKRFKGPTPSPSKEKAPSTNGFTFMHIANKDRSDDAPSCLVLMAGG